MVSSACDFVVHIYQSEIDEIRRNYEEQKQTVGDLFGLWTTSGNVVVHLALSVQGVGEDLESFLKTKYMLCHVGKWQYEANEAPNTKPAGELEQTATGESYCARDGYNARVVLNFRGRQDEDVQLAYLGIGPGTKSCTGNPRILVLQTKSNGEASHNPLRNVREIREMLGKRKSVQEINKQDPTEVSSASQVKHNRSPMSAGPVVIHVGQQENSRPAGRSIGQTQQPVSNSANSSTTSQYPRNSAGQQPTLTEFLSSSNGERVLEEVLKEISSMVQDPQKIDVQRTLATGYIELKFEIKETKFEVQFPKTFPDVPAKILVTSPKQPYQFDLKPSKTNEEFHTSKSILNALRFFSAGFFKPQPSTQQLTATACLQSVGTFFSKVAQVASKNHGVPKEDAVMKFSEELCANITENFSVTGVVNVQIKNDKPGKRVEHRFKHYQRTYLIAIPVEFPEKSARIYCSPYSIGREVEVVSKSRRPINNLSEILNAVKYDCTCTKCFLTRNK